jgi:hypothetical protein
MRAARIDQTARPKFTSVYPCSWSSLFQAMLSKMNFRPSMMVGSVATFLKQDQHDPDLSGAERTVARSERRCGLRVHVVCGIVDLLSVEDVGRLM